MNNFILYSTVTVLVYSITTLTLLLVVKHSKFKEGVDREFIKSILFLPAINSVVLCFCGLSVLSDLSVKISNKLLGE